MFFYKSNVKINLKKLLKRLVLTFSVLVILAMTFLFILLKYKLEDTIEYLVESESNECFNATIGYSDYSYWKDRIILKNVELNNRSCSDKAVKKLKIKEVILDVKGIYPMILGHDYRINRLYINGIEFNIELKNKGNT